MALGKVAKCEVALLNFVRCVSQQTEMGLALIVGLLPGAAGGPGRDTSACLHRRHHVANVMVMGTHSHPTCRTVNESTYEKLL